MNKHIAWLKINEHPGGGIRCWGDGAAYPEVTGYLIPTLLNYGDGYLVERCINWLLSIQQPCGAFPGMDEKLYTFDNGAIVEGLEAYYQHTGSTEVYDALTRCREWIARHARHDGHYYLTPYNHNAAVHNVRVNWIMRSAPHLWFWRDARERSHYLAYGLEGYLRGGWFVENAKEKLASFPFHFDGLAPMWIDNGVMVGTDVIATAQLAILKLFCGMNADKQIDAVRKWGNIQSIEYPQPMSWGAKFILDMERLCN